MPINTCGHRSIGRFIQIDPHKKIVPKDLIFLSMIIKKLILVVLSLSIMPGT